MARADPSPAFPLVVRVGALGDMIMLTPALRALARRLGARCEVVTNPGGSAAILDGLPYVRAVRSLRSRSTPYWLDASQRELVAWLRSRSAGPVWVFEPSPKIAWLLDRGDVAPEQRVTLREVPRGDVEHAVAHALRMTATLPGTSPAASTAAPPLDDPSSWPDLPTREGEREACLRWLGARDLLDRPLVLLQTLTRNLRRGRWPTERWTGVVGEVLAAMPNARVLLLGAPWERRWVGELAAACADPRVLDVSDALHLPRLVELCRLAHSCISLDTGPAHVAAAAGCPLVVLVGRADPRRNRPLGPGPVRVVTAWPREAWPSTRAEWEASHRVDAIALDAVVSAWREVAAERARAEPPGRAAAGSELRSPEPG